MCVYVCANGAWRACVIMLVTFNACLTVCKIWLTVFDSCLVRTLAVIDTWFVGFAVYLMVFDVRAQLGYYMDNLSKKQ